MLRALIGMDWLDWIWNSLIAPCEPLRHKVKFLDLDGNEVPGRFHPLASDDIYDSIPWPLPAQVVRLDHGRRVQAVGRRGASRHVQVLDQVAHQL